MNDTDIRPPYRWAALIGAAVFGLYIATLAPTTAFWDTSEYIAAAKVLGIPHPPGNPLFTLMAHVWGMFPFAADYAVRINLFAAVTSAGSAAFWFLVLERWLRSIIPDRTPRLLAACAGIVIAATTWTVWNQSTVNEKVYTVSMFSIALIMWLTVRWADLTDQAHRDRLLITIVYLLALTSTNHLMGILVAPAVGIYILLTDWKAPFRPWVLGSIVAAYALGVSLNYVYLPMRAAQYPPINEGEPICSGIIRGITGGCQDLSDVLNRVQYGKPALMDRQSPLSAQIANFLQYFGWQWARDWGGWAQLATGLFALLGLLGIGKLFEKDKRAALAAIALMGTLTCLLVFYMNFKYGYSMHPEIQPFERHEVRERDYFYVAAFAFWGVWVGLGLATAWSFLNDALAKSTPGARKWVTASPVLLIALIPLAGNHITASRAHETMARDLAHDILESVAPYGILITAGDNDTFPLWYAQEVEGIRPDVTLANLSLMNTRWHLRQLRRRVTPPFDVSRASVVWKDRWQAQDVPGYPVGKPIPQPTSPVFTSLSIDDLNRLPELSQIRAGQAVAFDSLVMQLQGVSIQGAGTYLELSDLATIGLIKDNLHTRPIYFSWTTGNHPDRQLGLMPYLVSEGLVRRLNPTPVRPTHDIVASGGLGYVDVAQTDQLLWKVYHIDEAARVRPRGWVDPPSASILSIYAVIYGNMAAVYQQAGDTAKARKASDLARAVQANLPQ